MKMGGVKKDANAVLFFVPADLWPDDITSESGYFWSANRSGKWNWTIQTYQHLKEGGFECTLTKELPTSGIIVAHREVLPNHLKPSGGQLLVCIQADHGRHPYAQLHVLQNSEGVKAAQASRREQVVKKIIPFNEQSIFLKYWPQPELIPRSEDRRDRFENVVYMGRAKNLAPALRSDVFIGEMEKLGINWQVEEDRAKWVDYQEIDAIVAVRDFDREPHLHKPATKLYNAWHAGVPAILGSDSAFKAERKSSLDYIEVHSVEDVIQAVYKLKTDAAFRQQMINNGRERAKETTTEVLTDAWIHFFEEVAYPAYQLWRKQPVWKQQLYLTLLNLFNMKRQ